MGRLFVLTYNMISLLAPPLNKLLNKVFCFFSLFNVLFKGARSNGGLNGTRGLRFAKATKLRDVPEEMVATSASLGRNTLPECPLSAFSFIAPKE